MIKKNKLNAAFAILAFLMVGLGCEIFFDGIENTKWTGSYTESNVTIPFTFDIFPKSKAFVGITVPGVPAPLYFPTTWTKSGNVVTLKWNEGSFTGTVTNNSMSGNLTNKDGKSFPLMLHKE